MVIYNLDRSAFRIQLQHRTNEILAKWAVYPGGAHDDMSTKGLSDRKLTFQLTFAIDVKRSDRICLHVWTRMSSVENVVSGEVN